MTLRVKLLKSFFSKSIGLLGAKKAYPVYFTTRFGIHTFFLKFPIDVLVLDKNYIVVKLCEGLLPNRIFFWSPRFDTIIELPSGEIRKRKIKCGEKIVIKAPIFLAESHQW
ncbi:MAG TPA: DUF192 domain-containing protein [Methylomirabilota bacterium]|nr:DUF192 domain-containing protein [Methylomirabilota bacterium]